MKILQKYFTGLWISAQKLFQRGLLQPKGSEAYRRARFILTCGLMSLAVLLLYIISSLLGGNYLFAKVSCIGFFLILVAIYRVIKNRDSKVTILLIICCVCFFVFISLFYGKKESYSLVWMAAVPVITYYLLGSHKGLWLNSFFLLFLLIFLFSLPRSVLSPLSIVNVMFCMLLLVVMLYCYEKSREVTQSALEEKQLELERACSTDALTGVYNRMKIDRIAEETFASQGTPSANRFHLILIDIDHFKQVNDSFGHQQGDLALKAVAAFLREQCGPESEIARWGGEEFLIFLKGHTTEQAVRLTESLCTGVEQLHFQNGMKVTISIGLAAFRAGDSYDTLLGRADSCLYRAKSGGRNCFAMSL